MADNVEGKGDIDPRTGKSKPKGVVTDGKGQTLTLFESHLSDGDETALDEGDGEGEAVAHAKRVEAMTPNRPMNNASWAVERNRAESLARSKDYQARQKARQEKYERYRIDGIKEAIAAGRKRHAESVRANPLKGGNWKELGGIVQTDAEGKPVAFKFDKASADGKAFVNRMNQYIGEVRTNNRNNGMKGKDGKDLPNQARYGDSGRAFQALQDAGLLSYDREGNVQFDSSKIKSQAQLDALTGMLDADDQRQNKAVYDQNQRDQQTLEKNKEYLKSKGADVTNKDAATINKEAALAKIQAARKAVATGDYGSRELNDIVGQANVGDINKAATVGVIAEAGVPDDVKAVNNGKPVSDEANYSRVLDSTVARGLDDAGKAVLNGASLAEAGQGARDAVRDKTQIDFGRSEYDPSRNGVVATPEQQNVNDKYEKIGDQATDEIMNGKEVTSAVPPAQQKDATTPPAAEPPAQQKDATTPPVAEPPAQQKDKAKGKNGGNGSEKDTAVQGT